MVVNLCSEKFPKNDPSTKKYPFDNSKKPFIFALKTQRENNSLLDTNTISEWTHDPL